MKAAEASTLCVQTSVKTLTVVVASLVNPVD